MFMTNFLDEAGFKVFEAIHADEPLTVVPVRPDVKAVIADIKYRVPMSAVRG